MNTDITEHEFDENFFQGLSMNLEAGDIENLNKKGSALGQVGFTSHYYRNLSTYYFFSKKAADCTVIEKSVLLALGMATAKAKQPERLYNAASHILPLFTKSGSALTIMRDVISKMKRVNRSASMNDITGQRFAAAFPDFAAAGIVLANMDTPETSIFNYVNKEDMTIPTVLAYAQSYQLHLTSLMKKVASYYNVKYWIQDVNARTEVKGGPKFIFSYHQTGLKDAYKPYIEANKLDDEVKKNLKSYPYDLHGLFYYEASVVCAMRKKGVVDHSDVMKTMEDWEITEKYIAEKEAEFEALPAVDVDFDSDGNPMGNVSSSSDYISKRLTESSSATGMATTTIDTTSSNIEFARSVTESLKSVLSSFSRTPVIEASPDSEKKMTDTKFKEKVENMCRDMTPQQRMLFRKKMEDNPKRDMMNARDETLLDTRNIFSRMLNL